MRRGLGELTEAIYRATVDPGAWSDVMALTKQRFRSSAETLYFLDFRTRRMRPIHIAGISEEGRRRFDELYFTPDNPWLIHSRVLHRPGLIRTNERLARYTGDATILYRSCLYNEWMRPECVRYGLATTLATAEAAVANVTLMRPPDMPTFGARDVRDFEAVSLHLSRAIEVAIRLETLTEQRDQSWRAIDAMAGAVIFVDRDARVQYANRAAEEIFRRRDGLEVRDGVLLPTRPSVRAAFDALLRSVHTESEAGHGEAPVTVELPRADGARPLRVGAGRISAGKTLYGTGRATILLTVSDPESNSGRLDERLRYAYGLTSAEARLARALVEGASLREAAGRQGITYTTARGYMKAIFQKTGTNRQGQLVARLARDVPVLR